MATQNQKHLRCHLKQLKMIQRKVPCASAPSVDGRRSRDGFCSTSGRFLLFFQLHHLSDGSYQLHTCPPASLHYKSKHTEAVVSVQPFCRNKNHPDYRKSEALPSAERCSTKLCVDRGRSAGLGRAGRGGDKRIHQQRRCKHEETAAMQKTQRFYRSIHCEVEFGVWKFIQVDFTPLISPPLGG